MQAYDISGLNILVLEKNVLIRRLLTDVFREFGVPTVQSTANVDAAFQMFCQFPVDIILSDWTYDLDGMEFLKKVRLDADSPNPFIPVIVITANTEIRHVFEARDTGMTEYLAKPISAKLIYMRIISVIENNRAFVRVNNFFGPDRRRRIGDKYIGSERRHHLTMH